MTEPPAVTIASSPGDAALLDQLTMSLDDDEQITIVLGSGVSAQAVPTVEGILRLADHYAAGRGDDSGLRLALAQAREEADEGRPINIYAAYRRVFADWVSGDEFDVIAQQAVLAAYRPPDRMASPLATHGIWHRVDLQLGERVENDRGSWLLPPGIEAAGALLARMAEDFGNQVLTTNFDPLMEIAIRSAGGRAVSLPLDSDGDYGTVEGEDGAVRVFHLHGFWRPTLHMSGPRLVHDPNLLTTGRDQLVASVARLIRGDAICVLGCSDWAGTLTEAIATVRSTRALKVLWAAHSDDQVHAARLSERLAEATGDAVNCYSGVDGGRLLPLLAEARGIDVSPRTTGPRHRVRHHTWERQLVTQPTVVPPAEVPGLLLQLERRFGWVVHQAGAGKPAMLFWPVRLRPPASVIHMVQAFAAGALAQRGLRVVVCLDDLGLHGDAAQDFAADIERWVRHTRMKAGPEFFSLTTFINDPRRRESSGADTLRPTDPWAVARAFYGERNPSLYSVLAAVKAIPNLTTVDELEENAWSIVQALFSKDANRLLTPLTLWSFLHDQVRQESNRPVMTLGGRDEALFWEQWRETFGFGASQLYNPFIRSLSNKSEMLRWSSADQLRQHLHRTHAIPGWEADGSYIPWLFQNALLLPIYLTRRPFPEIGGIALDSWAAFVAALEEQGATVLDLLADLASQMYLRGTWA